MLNIIFKLERMRNAKEQSEYIRHLLTMRGLTITWFAKQMGESTQNTNNFLRRGLPASKLSKAAMCLGVTRDEIEGLTENQGEIAPENTDLLQLTKWSASFSQGSGLPAELQHDEIIETLGVTRDWAKRHLSKATDFKKIELVTGLGDSMTPTYKDGETLFLDTGHNDFKLDAVYAFRLYDEFYIKRISRRKGEYLAISDNPKYPPMPITQDDFEHLHVYGRIINGARIFDM